MSGGLKPSPVRVVLQSAPCPTCRARAGEPCRSLTSGRTGQQGSDLVHAARRTPERVLPNGQSRRGPMPSLEHVDAQGFPCTTCGARAGEVCRSTRSGRAVGKPHAPRERASNPYLSPAHYLPTRGAR